MVINRFWHYDRNVLRRCSGVRCDCGMQLAQAMKQIDDEGCGVLVYMRQEGRGIGPSIN